MAKANYHPAPEVRKIAEDLIPKYHQHLIDFSVKLEYIFVDKTPKRKGREIWGTCRKVSSLNAFLANEKEGSDPFFVIVISEPVWDVLPPDKRIALVDHELCHAWAEANQKEDDDEADPVKLSVNPHDLEEFSCIVRRHGLWREDVKSFVEAATRKSNDKSAGNESKSPEPSQSEGV
jgi:predicted metallopeptidase